MTSNSKNVEEVIRARITEKVLSSLEERALVPVEIEARCRPLVESAIRTAGWAPFHYPRNIDGLAEPWRAHVLWNKSVRKLSQFLSDELKLTSKEPQLAAACSALVLVTWIPEEASASPGQTEDTVVIRNEEHLAATSAMVQNLLLALTAKDIGNYWSSGGKLRDAEVFDYLGIPKSERLLAAVFIEYPEMREPAYGETTRKRGALRSKRSSEWVRFLPPAD
ncbi:MAG: nitroreductase family protein [Verrucomicrobiota bacterium]